MAKIETIGNVRVDFTTNTIDGPAGEIAVEPKVMSLLKMLAENAGNTVSRDDLLNAVWGKHQGGDESLSRAMSLLRSALGDQRDERNRFRYIRTIPKHGYRLVADVGFVEQEARNKRVIEDISPPKVESQSSIGRTKKKLLSLLGIMAIGILIFSSFYWAEDTINDPAENLAFLNPALQMPDQNSIAVLPFADLSLDGDQQYFADGLAEEILNTIIRFPNLRVVGRTSSFMFRNDKPDLKEIRSTLKVSHILIGSVREQKSKIRVTVQLLKTDDGFVVWSENYDGTSKNIFDLQETIAVAIAEKLDVSLDSLDETRYSSALTSNQEAYDLFLQGRELSRRFGQENKIKAIELLRKATIADPDFAAAWAWMGSTQLLLTISADGSNTQSLVNDARASIGRALVLDPDLAMGHYAYSLLQDYDLDFASSFESMKKAYALQPNQPFLKIRLGYYHGLLGNGKKAEQMMEAGLRQDPTDAAGLLNLGIVKLYSGKKQEALKLMHRSNDLGFLPAAGWLCLVGAMQGKVAQGEECLLNLPISLQNRYAPVFDDTENWRTLAAAAFREDRASREISRELLDRHFQNPDARTNAYLIGAYLDIGEPKRFMDTFISHPFPINASLISFIWIDSDRSQQLRRHKEFPAFAERIGLVDAWQKYGWPDQCVKNPLSDGSGGSFRCQ